jgi:hypothetical protein
MDMLQELATKFKLPAIALAAVPTSSLPEKARLDLTKVGGNEELYSLFAKNLDARKVVRFSVSIMIKRKWMS